MAKSAVVILWQEGNLTSGIRDQTVANEAYTINRVGFSSPDI